MSNKKFWQSSLRQWPMLAALWASASIAQPTGVMWEAGFDSVHTLTAGLGALRAQPSFDQDATLASGPGGDFYFFSRDIAGRPVVSLLSRADDSIIRQHTAGGQGLGIGFAASAGRPLIDGGALLLRQGLARFAADGRLLWSRDIGTTNSTPARVVQLATGDLIVIDGQGTNWRGRGWSISRVDAQTGATLGVRDFPPPAGDGCGAIPLGSDGEGHVYATELCQGDHQRQRLLKLAPDLTPVWTRNWNLSSTGDWLPKAVVVDSQGVVLERQGASGQRELVRFRGTDGSIAWSRPGNWFDVQAGTDGRWAGFVSDDTGSRVEGLDVTTGATLWSHGVDLQEPVLRVAEGDVLISGVDDASTRSVVERRSLVDGSIVWRREFTGSRPGVTFVPRDLLASGDRVRVAGNECASSSCVVGIARLGRVAGNLEAISYPTSPQTAGADADQDADQWMVASLEDHPQGAHVRAKRFDANGMVTWERVFPTDGARGRYQWARVRRMPDGDLLVVAGGRTCCGHFSRYAEDGQTLRWRRSLTTDFYPPGHVAFDLDAAGDLIVSASRNNGTGIFSSWIEKLDGTSGATVWRGNEPSHMIDFGPRRFWLVGNDVFTFGTPHASRCGQLLSGNDGSRRWIDQCEFSSAFLGAQNGDIYLWSADGTISAVSVADGSVRWRRDVMGVGDEYEFASGLIDGGDLYVGGSRTDGSGRSALLARLDRASGSLVWINRFTGQAAGPPRAPVALRELSSGALIATQSDGMRTFVSRFDPADGHFLDGRQLSTSDVLDSAIPNEPASFGPPAMGGGRFSVGTAYRPGLPSGPWVGRLIAPDAGHRGELSVSMENVPDAIRPGDTFGLAVTIAHSGAQPMTDALAFVHLGRPAVPAQSGRLGLSDLACEVSGGGTCDAVRTPGGVRAALALSPGTSVRLTATVRVLAEGSISVIAEAYAPYGWLETQLRDNVAERVLVTDRIFSADFD